MEETDTSRLFRFGVYEAAENSGELRKQGRRLRLQSQPFQVLLMLLERPGAVVTREEIRLRLWPEGTFVDFDHGLNTAINKLRETLGDSAGNPRFIETLAKRGYRFIAPVELVEPGAIQPAPAASEIARCPDPEAPCAPRMEQQPQSEPEPAVNEASALTRFLTQPHQVPRPPGGLVRALFLLIQIMYLCFYLASLARLGEVGSMLSGMMRHGWALMALLMVTAAIAIPARLYLIMAVLFEAPGFKGNFGRLFPFLFPLDELWALAPFLLVPQIGFGLALGATAALIYVPFAQRSLVLMGAGRES
jgi:DNA-binding winged helix-turn-helix (wHTH) protein